MTYGVILFTWSVSEIMSAFGLISCEFYLNDYLFDNDSS